MEVVSQAGFGRLHHHPYTLALLASIPVPKPESKIHAPPLSGDVPSPINPPPGCPFHPRCPEMIERCADQTPLLREIEAGQWAACHRR
jgi:peptide/nickel transport system ATP-binding protein